MYIMCVSTIISHNLTYQKLQIQLKCELLQIKVNYVFYYFFTLGFMRLLHAIESKLSSYFKRHGAPDVKDIFRASYTLRILLR